MGLFEEKPTRTVRIFCTCVYTDDNGQKLNGVFDFDIVDSDGYWGMTTTCSNPECLEQRQIHHFPKKEKVGE